MIIVDVVGTSVSVVNGLRFNNDTGAHYSFHNIEIGTSKTQNTGKTKINMSDETTSFNNTEYQYSTVYVSNRASYSKMVNMLTALGGGDFQISTAGEWTNTSDQITRVDLVTTAGTATYNSGSRLTVYGMD